MQGRIDKISGPVQAGRWSQVHEFAKGDLRLLGAVSFVGPDISESETISLGREVLARIQELIFASAEEDISLRIKKSFQVLGSEFPTLSVSLGILQQGILYVGSLGAAVWTRRADGREGFVVAPGKTGFASSRFSAGDVVIFGNADFFASLPMGTIRAAINSSNGIEQLVTMSHSAGQQHNLVAAILSGHPDPEMPQVATVSVPWWDKLLKAPIYVSYTDRDQAKKRVRWVGVGFLAVMLLLVVGFQIYKNQTDVGRLEAKNKLADAQQKFNEARAVVQLNRTRSQQLLTDVSQELDSLAGNKYALADSRYSDLKQGLNEAKDEAAGIIRHPANLVLDMSLVRENTQVSQLSLLGTQLLALDVQNNRLFNVDLTKKSADVLAGPTDLGTSKLLASYPGKVEVLSDKGVVECSVSSIACTVKIKFDPAWGVIEGMGMFGGNVYLLTDQTVWRHQVNETGFSDKQDWLAATEDRSILTTRKNMAIDGFIWTAGLGQIDKYARGVHENFPVTGLDQSLGGNLYLYTDGDINNLYVLDRDNGKILVVDKTNGQYLKQYVGDSFKNITNFVVDEKGGQIYFGQDSKIMEVAL